MSPQQEEEIKAFVKLIQENKYDFCRLVYLLFPFGQVGHDLEKKAPFDWQMREWKKMSDWFTNPTTRYQTYKLVISTGNGSGKTAFCAMTAIMLMYLHMLRGRLTANTKPQLTQVVWPQYDKWLRYARYNEIFFEKFGESIKSRDEKKHDQWQFSLFTWDEQNPAAVSGLHNEGHAVLYVFEEAPGIPAEIFKYANGAFAVTNTIKMWLVVGNSDDPDSKFEKLMSDPEWSALRIDTRTLENVDKNFVASVLRECGGDEDADDFRVRVRGLPRKTNADSIISRDKVAEAFDRAPDFNISSVTKLPCIITVDPAWTGGDFTTIWVHQGNWSKLLRVYKLNAALKEDHRLTYDLVVGYEKDYCADAVWIDQGEGTALKTFANQDQRYHWELVSFAQSPNDNPDRAQSDYANMRAQMYYEARKYFMNEEAVIEIGDDIEYANIIINNKPITCKAELRDAVVQQMGYTKGDRHKITMKKLCESKKDIKSRVGESPDLADGYVLKFYRVLQDRLEENQDGAQFDGTFMGERAREYLKKSNGIDLPEQQPDYSMRFFNGRL